LQQCPIDSPKYEKIASCAYQKLHPAIMMMKSAEDRLSSELAEPLDRPMAPSLPITTSGSIDDEVRRELAAR
jgi:hypothetical protein